MEKWLTNGAVIVSWDLSHGVDKAILLVAKQTKGEVDVINAFQGQEALDIYKKLLTEAGEV